MQISLSPETIIIVFCFGMLAASVFLKHLLIYIALCCAWLAVIFYPAVPEFPGYLQLTALAVVFFGVFSINKLRQGGDL